MERRASNTLSQSGQKYSYTGIASVSLRNVSSRRSSSCSLYVPRWAESRSSCRQLLAAACLVVLSLSSLGFGPPVLVDGGNPPLRLFPSQMEAIADLANAPAVSARAALLADAVTGAVISEKNAHEPLPPASTTKIMTALIALEGCQLNDLVQVPAEALEIGEASMGLLPGEKVTVEDLLFGLLLVSGNDASVTIAVHTAGSVDSFVALMNERAVTLGLEVTHYANPHGLDAPGHVSSAADLLALTRAALQHAEFAEIVAAPQATVAGRVLYSTNELLSTYEGANGVKTGTTDEAGQCVVASASRHGASAIAVVLGSEDRFTDAAALLDHFFASYIWRELTLPRGRLAVLRGSEGTSWSLSAAQAPSAMLPAWQWPLVRTVISVNPAKLGNAKESVGSVRFIIGRQVLGEVPLMGVARGE